MRTDKERPGLAGDGLLDAGDEHAVVEHGAELRVRQAERPQAQVGGRIRHRAQHELDGVNHLVHYDLAEVKLAYGAANLSVRMYQVY